MIGGASLGRLAVGQEDDAAAAVAFETNIHFVGRFSPARLRVLPGLRQNIALGDVVETNVHFIARFNPVKYKFFRFNFEDNQDIEPPVTETNVHFIGRFHPSSFHWFRFNGFDVLPDAITHTEILTKPINCVLADQQFYKTRIDVNDIGPANFQSRVASSASKTERISGDSPSFTTKTDSKGYD